MEQLRIELGDSARDVITGFEGVIVAETIWMQGCRRLTVQPRDVHDGKPIEAVTFDETQLALVKREAVPAPNRKVRPTGQPFGGPRPEPRREADPR